MNKGTRQSAGPTFDSGPLIIGHRGASALAPENTHAAFVLAFDEGADGIEFDVRLASDGVPYVYHDGTLERTAGVCVESDVHSSTTLSELYAGLWFNRRYPSHARFGYSLEKIPTLAQVFARYGSDTLYAEMKCENPARRPALARAVVEMIDDYGVADKVVVKSFALDSLREVKRLAPKVRTAALFGRSWPRPFLPAATILAEAEACGADEISLHRSLLRSATVEEAHRRGFEVVVWTVNAPATLRHTLGLGLRAVITDHPGLMRATLDKLRPEDAGGDETG